MTGTMNLMQPSRFFLRKELNPIWMQNVWPFWEIFFAKALKLNI